MKMALAIAEKQRQLSQATRVGLDNIADCMVRCDVMEKKKRMQNPFHHCTAL